MPSRSLRRMNEGERDRAAVVMARQSMLSHGTSTGWDALYIKAIGSMWGRLSTSVEVVGMEPWVLRAEVSR